MNYAENECWNWEIRNLIKAFPREQEKNITCALEDAENGDTTSGTYEEAENDITLTLADGSVRKAVYSAGGIVYSGTYYPTKDTRKL